MNIHNRRVERLMKKGKFAAPYGVVVEGFTFRAPPGWCFAWKRAPTNNAGHGCYIENLKSAVMIRVPHA